MDTRERMKIYEELTSLSGIAGYEKAVRNYLKERLAKCSDEIIQDRLGSVFELNMDLLMDQS